MRRDKIYVGHNGMVVFPFYEENDELILEAFQLKDIDPEDFNQEGYDLIEKYNSFDGYNMKDKIVELVKLNPKKSMVKTFEEDYLPRIQENLIKNADIVIEEIRKEEYDISKEEYLKVANSIEILKGIFNCKVRNSLSEVIINYFIPERIEEFVFKI